MIWLMEMSKASQLFHRLLARVSRGHRETQQSPYELFGVTK